MSKKTTGNDQLIDQREPGFFIVDDEVIDEFGPLIGPLGVAIYNVLAKHANKSGASSFPSYQTIADKLGISRTTAINGVKILIENKLIKKEPRFDDSGDSASNNYKILRIKKHAKQTEEVVQNLDHPPEKLIRPGGTESALGSTESTPPVVQKLDYGGTDSVPEPDPLNQTHLNQTLTHTAARGNGKVCVCETPHRSKICDEERIRIASNLPNVRTPSTYAMTTEARRGTYDAMYLKRQKELQKPEATVLPERDTSACPDCKGTGFWYPQGIGKGAAKCRHPQLNMKLDPDFNEAQEEHARTG